MLIASIVCIGSAWCDTWTKELACGVTLTQTIDTPTDAGAAQVINVLRVDPKAPGVRVQAAIGRDHVYALDGAKGRETVRTMARRLGAVAAVNADYFAWTGSPLGMLISDGELIKDPWPGRVVFGMTSDKKFIFDQIGFDGRITLDDGRFFSIAGINRSRGHNELVLYTPKFFRSTLTSKEGNEAVIRCDDPQVRVGTPLTGTVTEVRLSSGNSPVPEGSIVLSGSFMGAKFISDNLKPGTKVSLRLDVRGSSTVGWDKVVQSVGGGPWLVRDGRVFVDASEEKFQPSFSYGANPRTALGVTSDGKLLIVTVDGRQHLSRGMSLNSLAELMKSLGCVQAMNLDGGGSTTMATSIGVLNSPSTGSERAVADGLAVFGTTPSFEEVRSSAAKEPTENRSGYIQLASRGGQSSSLAPSIRANMDKKPGEEFIIAPPGATIETGVPYRMLLLDAATYRPLDDNLAGKAIWSVTGTIGFIDQSGVLHPMRPTKGTVSARIGSLTAKISVEAARAAQVEENLTDPTDAPNASADPTDSSSSVNAEKR
jgi:hypothetical protein